jgi:hypothetical protein
MSRVDYELVYLPPGYKLLFVGTLSILVLLVVWTLMVWAVNERMRNATKDGKGKRKKRAGNGGEERRPMDKVSQYAHRHGSGGDIPISRGTEMDMGSDSAVTSAAQVPFSYLGNDGHVGEGIEMKYRPQHKTPQANRPRSRALHLEARDRSSTASSPVNPFLNPPAKELIQPGTDSTRVKRTSLEWQTARAAFMSTQQTTSTPVSRSASPAPSHSNDNRNESFELDVSDIEALEAGTAPLTGRKHPSSSSSSPRNGLVTKSKSWIDDGVGRIDGAVNAFVAKIGRWTYDDGGDDASLLPVAR